MDTQDKRGKNASHFTKAASIVFALALVGSLASACQSKASQQSQELPAATGTSSNSPSYTLTPASDLKSLEPGSTAIFDSYEITVTSADAANGKTVVAIKVKAHDQAQTLAARYLQTATGTIADTTFADGNIQCEANSEVSGTITFGSDSLSEVSWNAAGCDATWKLPAKQTDAAATPGPSTGSSESAPAASSAPKAAETPAPSTEPQTVTVYITDSGKKYHSAGCQYLKKSKIAIDLDSAKAEGYEPCSKCNPPR